MNILLELCPDTVSHISSFLEIEVICKLASVDSQLRELLRNKIHEARHKAFVRLSSMESLFAVELKWSTFNALYLVRKDIGVRRRFRSENNAMLQLTASETRFGFYTGHCRRHRCWHECILTIPPFWSNLGARLKIQSYRLRDNRRKSVFKKNGGIFTVEQLAYFLQTASMEY